MLTYNKKLIPLARALRKRMTRAEVLVWSKVRAKQLAGFQFWRQKPIGDYIVDFYCPMVNLVIEIDGGQHYLPEMAESDFKRDQYMQNLGLVVLRFSNLDVLNNIDGVVESILRVLNSKLH